LAGRNAEEELLCADLNQDCALFGAERDVRNDVDCASTRPAEGAQATDHPRRGEDCREDEQQRECDLCQAGGWPRGNGFSRFRRSKWLLGRERGRMLG
jgi:hypothetical protein